MNEDGPLQIIAKMLPQRLFVDEVERLDFAHDILIALDRSGYVILKKIPLPGKNRS